VSLIQLRETGICVFSIPEILFDMDFHGHYLRRLKAVTVTIPCIAGPYTSVNCILRLLSHKYRKDSTRPNAYSEASDTGSASDDRFSTGNVPLTAIAVTSGQNDAGVFELNFRDDRYMPFEGARGISTRRLELPQHFDFRQFDYECITDVVMQLSYTSLDGSARLKAGAMKTAKTFVNISVSRALLADS
jgi:hypothetical protein